MMNESIPAASDVDYEKAEELGVCDIGSKTPHRYNPGICTNWHPVNSCLPKPTPSSPVEETAARILAAMVRDDAFAELCQGIGEEPQWLKDAKSLLEDITHESQAVNVPHVSQVVSEVEAGLPMGDVQRPTRDMAKSETFEVWWDEQIRMGKLHLGSGDYWVSKGIAKTAWNAAVARARAEGSQAVDIEKAAHAHSNLTVLAGVVALLEGGTIYQSGTVQKTVNKIISLCLKEQQKQLKIYDRERGV